MFKKMSFKNLVIVFASLLIIVFIIKYVDSQKGERTFSKELVSFKQQNVNAITIIPKKDKTPVNLIKNADGWKVNSKDKSYTADEGMIDNMLKDLLKLESKRLAATSKEKWDAYEVTDSAATRVIVKHDSEVLADLFIGKFSYQQPKNQYQRQGTMTSYVRVANKKTVHAVDGFLSMTYNRDINSFRNKYVIKTKKEDVNKISFSYPDSSFTLLKENNKWTINGMAADSLSVDKYLSSIVVTNSQDFVDDIDIGTLGQNQYSMLIEGDNFSPIDVKTYMNLLDTANHVLITSSFNKGTVFSGSKSDLLDKLFVGKGNFLK